MEIATHGPADREQVIGLWKRCGLVVAHNDPGRDIDFCTSSGHGQVFVGRRGGSVIASAMVGHDGHRGWIYYLAVAPEEQGKGLGKAMVTHAERYLKELGVAKIQLMIRETNGEIIAFYERLGYEKQDVITVSKWLRDPARH